MAFPLAAAAVAAPAIGNFLGGVFGGSKKGESPEVIFQRNFKNFMKQLPKVDTKGLQSAQTADIDQSLRARGADRARKFGRLLGPNQTSVAQATAGAGDFADRANLLGQSRRNIANFAATSEQSRFSTAAGAALGLTGQQQEFSQRRTSGDRAAGLGFATLGQGAGDFFQQEQFKKLLGTTV